MLAFLIQNIIQKDYYCVRWHEREHGKDSRPWQSLVLLFCTKLQRSRREMMFWRVIRFLYRLQNNRTIICTTSNLKKTSQVLLLLYICLTLLIVCGMTPQMKLFFMIWIIWTINFMDAASVPLLIRVQIFLVLDSCFRLSQKYFWLMFNMCVANNKF